MSDNGPVHYLNALKERLINTKTLIVILVYLYVILTSNLEERKKELKEQVLRMKKSCTDGEKQGKMMKVLSGSWRTGK